jgi:hypothetical protein
VAAAGGILLAWFGYSRLRVRDECRLARDLHQSFISDPGAKEARRRAQGEQIQTQCHAIHEAWLSLESQEERENLVNIVDPVCAEYIRGQTQALPAD